MDYFYWGRLGSSNFPRKHHRDTAGRYYAKVLVSNMRRRVASSRTISLGDREDPWCHIPNTQGVFQGPPGIQEDEGPDHPCAQGKKRIRESFGSTKLNPFDYEFNTEKKKKQSFQSVISLKYSLIRDVDLWVIDACWRMKWFILKGCKFGIDLFCKTNNKTKSFWGWILFGKEKKGNVFIL